MATGYDASSGYTIIYGKSFEEETFTFRVENGYSLEKFCSSMLVDVYLPSYLNTHAHMLGCYFIPCE